MSNTYLDAKLECPHCGTITLDIPANAEEGTPVLCSRCGHLLGTWGDLQDDFLRQAGQGVFEMNHGRFRRKKPLSSE